MNKRSIPIAILGCILAVGGVAGYLAPSPTKATPTRLLLENTAGRVVFTHLAHSTPGQYGNADCADCHHELKIVQPPTPALAALAAPEATPSAPSDGAKKEKDAGIAELAAKSEVAVMPCSSCHGTADDPAFIAAHQQKYRTQGGDASCVACHHTRFTGFASGWNHEDHKSYASDDCTTCHHPASFERKDGKSMAHRPQKCSNCHTAKPNPLTSILLKDAVHAKCEPCHTALFEDKLKGCDTCHSRTATAQDLAKGTLETNFASCASCHGPMLSNMDTFHKNCMGCHDKTGKGPGAKAACAQCHRP